MSDKAQRGRPPYGRRVVDGVVVDDADEKALIALICEAHAQGDWTLSDIADHLNGEGYTTRDGSAWSIATVWRILQRKAKESTHRCTPFPALPWTLPEIRIFREIEDLIERRRLAANVKERIVDAVLDALNDGHAGESLTADEKRERIEQHRTYLVATGMSADDADRFAHDDAAVSDPLQIPQLWNPTRPRDGRAETITQWRALLAEDGLSPGAIEYVMGGRRVVDGVVVEDDDEGPGPFLKYTFDTHSSRNLPVWGGTARDEGAPLTQTGRCFAEYRGIAWDAPNATYTFPPTHRRCPPLWLLVLARRAARNTH